MSLTEEKERQIAQLLQVITEEAALFRKTSHKSVVKIPFTTLEEKHLHPDKAESLIGYMNSISGSYEEGAIEILNGTIHDDRGVIGTLHTGVLEELENVKIDDSKRFLLLWLHNFGRLKKKVTDSLHLSGDRAPQHMVIDDTPDDSSWSSLRLQFIDGRTLHISIPTKNWAKNGVECEHLGLAKKSGRPKEQWHILEEAATQSGRIKLTSTKTRKESRKKQIDLLKAKLKEVFPRLSGEPIKAMDSEAYQMMFEIIPEQREDSDSLE